MEIKDKEDVEIIKEANIETIGLKIEKPKKMSPSLIIYDVEKDYKIEDMKEDFLNKNFDKNNVNLINDLKEKIVFKYSFKAKENRVNWIVQVPGTILGNLVNRGRIYMLWRTYRVKEYLNVIRYFKCHGFGHIAKVCNVSDQLCETCGEKGHLKTKCKRKDTP